MVSRRVWRLMKFVGFPISLRTPKHGVTATFRQHRNSPTVKQIEIVSTGLSVMLHWRLSPDRRDCSSKDFVVGRLSTSHHKCIDRLVWLWFLQITMPLWSYAGSLGKGSYFPSVAPKFVLTEYILNDIKTLTIWEWCF